MGLPDDISSQRAKFVGTLLLLLPLLAAGCANPGPPHAPSLHLPEVVTNLSAERSGAEVKLRWTTPSKTTDGVSITSPMVAQICRASASSASCSPVSSTPVKPGPSEATDMLPPALNKDPQTLLEYRVSILNSRQRSAGSSAPAFVASGSTPPVVASLRIEATEQGAMLQWEPGAAADVIELDRLHLTAAEASSHQAGQGFRPASKEPVEMRFRAAKASPENSPFRADAGGSLDATAHRSETYTYTAQRVRKTLLQGHALEIRSVLSPAVTVVMRDTFPPKPPTGLDAILAGQAAASPAMDLSWRPNTEPDLAGYLVYRKELGPDGASLGDAQRLTKEPILEPGFRDTSIVAGHTYRYSLVAVDISGNESASGTSVTETVPAP